MLQNYITNYFFQHDFSFFYQLFVDFSGTRIALKTFHPLAKCDEMNLTPPARQYERVLGK